MRKQLKILTTYLTPAMLTLFIGIIILAVQGIWPFGVNTVDYYDMGQQVAAEYIQIYDEIHAAKSPFFDWYLLSGHGVPGGTYISILNLFMYFMPRDMILEFFFFFLLLRVMLMAVALMMCLKSEAPDCPDFYATMLATGYGLCGYMLLMYTIIGWLDIAIVVPLIVTLVRRVLTDGRIGSFSLCLSFAFILGFYVPAMILIYVFLSAGLYLTIHLFSNLHIANKSITYEKSSQRLYVVRLGLGVLIGLLLSAFIWVPDLIQASGSMRIGLDGNKSLLNQYLDIITHVQPDYATRLWVFLGISFAAAATCIGLVRDLKCRNYKRFAFTTGNIILVCAGYVFESIQLFWCFGSYVNYPARNGFLVYIVFAIAAAKYIPEFVRTNSEVLAAKQKHSKVRVYSRGRMVGYEDEIKTGLNILVGAGLVVSVLLSAGAVYWYQSGSGRSIYDVFRVSILCVAGTFVIYILLMLVGSGRLAKLSVFILCAELIFYGVALIGEPNYYTGYTEGAEQESEYVRISDQLREKLGIQPSYLDRIKNPDNSLNANYGRFLRRGTIAGWLPSTAMGVISSSASMGYTTQYTRVLSSGGNVFTDALMHVTQLVSLQDQDDVLYKKCASASVVTDHKTGQKTEYSLYDSVYRLSFGTIVSSEAALNDIMAAGPGIDSYNALYRAIDMDSDVESGVEADDNIARLIETAADGSPIAYMGDNNEIYIEGNKALYLMTGSVDADFENVEISVNGYIITVPTINNVTNTRFPTQFNNNCMLLGSFADETVTVRVDIDASIEAPQYDFRLYTIDLEALSELCSSYAKMSDEMIFTAGGQSIKAQVNAEKAGEYLLLPVAYDEGWSAKVNGVATRPIMVNGIMMALPLCEGNNIVEMRYSPVGMRMCLVLAVILLAVCAAYEAVLDKVKKTRNESRFKIISRILTIEKKIDPVILHIYSAGWMLVILGMYIIPIVYGFYFYASRLIH